MDTAQCQYQVAACPGKPSTGAFTETPPQKKICAYTAVFGSLQHAGKIQHNAAVSLTMSSAYCSVALLIRCPPNLSRMILCTITAAWKSDTKSAAGQWATNVTAQRITLLRFDGHLVSRAAEQ